jgi:hypothetical protein
MARLCRPVFRKFAEQSVTVVPADRPHECINVSCGLGAEVDVIRVFIHVERENWSAAGEREWSDAH